MDYLNVNIRKAILDDIPAILEIERLTFVEPWTEKDLLYELEQNPVSNLWVIELEIEEEKLKSVVGFCDYWNTFDSGTIAQIAVHPTLQHKQLGSAMMDEIYNDCLEKKVRHLTLEVRKSNLKAICFYEKHGFKKEVIKPHYYSNGEDAWYMILEVK